MDTPRFLYKYCRWNEWSKETIQNHTLFFSTNSLLNDPEDCHRPIDCEASLPNILSSPRIPDAIRQIALKRSRDWKKDFVEQCIHEVTDSFGICSLTIKADEPYMWNDYTNHGKGLCFCFDTQYDPSFFLGYWIEYVDQLNKYTYHQNDEFYRELMGYKTKKWEIEKEFRLVRTQSQIVENNSRSFAFKAEALRSIIFGNTLTEEQKQEIMNLCRASGLEHVSFHYI